MAEPYYRLSTAKSELETILYDSSRLADRLEAESAALEAAGQQDGIPSLSSIKYTHRFPFRTLFTPVVNSANQFIVHDAATNRRFTIEYGGEFAARMYQAIDFSAGTIAAVNGADTVLWAYCPNLVASILINIAYKV